MRTATPVTTDRERAAAHAQAYHEAAYEASADGFAPGYKVWTWEEIPPENKELLVQASLIFLARSGGTSAEQLAISLMAEARRRAVAAEIPEKYWDHLGLRLAEWASQARQLGVAHHNERARLSRELADATEALRMAVEDMNTATAKLALIREIATSDAMDLVAQDQILEVLDGR